MIDQDIIKPKYIYIYIILIIDQGPIRSKCNTYDWAKFDKA